MIKGKKDSKGLLTLVDGSAFIFRAYYALPPLTRSDGMPINAGLGYCNMLWRLITDNKSDILLVIFDTARKSFRNNIYSEYKANRGEPPDDLKPQFSLVRDATEAFNIFYVENGGWHFTNIRTPASIEKKLLNFAHHYEFEKSGLNLENLKKMVEEKKVVYDHSVDKRGYKWSGNTKLKTLNISEMPKYLQENQTKYKDWLEN